MKEFRISCLLLAAGLGRRFGGRVSKLLQDYKTQPLINCALSPLLSLKQNSVYVSEIIIITGHQHKEIEKTVRKFLKENNALADKQIKFAHNKDYRSGLYSSLLCGIKAASDETNHLLVMPADMPKVTPKAINDIIHPAIKEKPSKVKPMFYIPTDKADKKRIGNPILLDKAALPFLFDYKKSAAKSQADKGAIDFIRRFTADKPHLLQAILLDEKHGTFTDIDEKSDLQGD